MGKFVFSIGIYTHRASGGDFYNSIINRVIASSTAKGTKTALPLLKQIGVMEGAFATIIIEKHSSGSFLAQTIRHEVSQPLAGFDRYRDVKAVSVKRIKEMVALLFDELEVLLDRVELIRWLAENTESWEMVCDPVSMISAEGSIMKAAGGDSEAAINIARRIGRTIEERTAKAES